MHALSAFFTIVSVLTFLTDCMAIHGVCTVSDINDCERSFSPRLIQDHFEALSCICWTHLFFLFHDLSDKLKTASAVAHLPANPNVGPGSCYNFVIRQRQGVHEGTWRNSARNYWRIRTCCEPAVLVWHQWSDFREPWGTHPGKIALVDLLLPGCLLIVQWDEKAAWSRTASAGEFVSWWPIIAANLPESTTPGMEEIHGHNFHIGQ